MSLLMDALKKAEQEKKEAAKRLKEAQDISQDDGSLTQELSVEDNSAQSVPEVGDPAPSEVNQIKQNDGAKPSELSLSPVEAQNAGSKDDGSSVDLSASDTSLTIEKSDSTSTDAKAPLDLGDVTVSERSVNKDQTLALDDFQSEASAITEDTVQSEQSPYDTGTLADDADEYFSASISAAQLAEDIGSDSPTPVAAQTVFTASSNQHSNQLMQWSVFVILSIVIVVSLSFFIFNYTIPVGPSVKSSLIARGIETQPESLPAIEIPKDFVYRTDEISDVIEKENTEIVNSFTVNNESELENKAGGDQATLEQENIWYPSDDVSVTDATDEAVSVLPEEIIIQPKLIAISRKKSIDKQGDLIHKAFNEYLSGNYTVAETSYRSALKELPSNRDALLGIAAISIRNGDIRKAYDNYLEVLRLYPGDSVAEAALINFQANGDSTKNESVLKSFIQREPKNSFLYYSLGRLYAAQKRWPEAQQSFFDAYKIETLNADFAFNLAVSLDHLGKKQSAKDYYNAALELENDNATSFDRAVVISRISALSHLTKSQ